VKRLTNGYAQLSYALGTFSQADSAACWPQLRRSGYFLIGF
jgi:hypothetical protein